MTFTLTINCDNADFEGLKGPTEVTRLLRHVGSFIEAEPILAAGATGNLRDLNGNTVGHWAIKGD